MSNKTETNTEGKRMRTLRNFDRRISAVIACLTLIMGVALPAAFPIAVYAGSITSRSIALTSSAADASGVTYHLTATLETGLSAGGGLVVEFCDDSPLIGLSCNHPAGFSAASVNTTGSTTAGTATSVNSNYAISWAATGAVSAGSTVDITFNSIHNPTAVGTFYARLTSYVNGTNLGGYTNATTGIGTYADSGGIALSTTNNIGVTAYVRESLVFCVANQVPDAACDLTGATGSTNPSMTLGEDVGNGQKALDPNVISTGVDYAQLSTNAASGAVVNLHSSTTGCGGLVRLGAANCDITPQTTAPSSSGDITAGQAKFGVKAGPAVDTTSGTHTGSLALAGSYDGAKYFLDYVTGDATGVTSPYGSPFFNSAGAPVANKNMPFTFGVSASPSTPAGIYSATLYLVATGTF